MLAVDCKFLIELILSLLDLKMILIFLFNSWFIYNVFKFLTILQQIPNFIYIYDLGDEFIILLLQANHNFQIANEFNIVLMDIDYTFQGITLLGTPNLFYWKNMTNKTS